MQPPLAHACAPEVAGGDSAGPPTAFAVPRPGSRLIGIDAARGVALIGMMAVHTMDPFSDDGTASGAWTLASGKAAALFALLAGLGLALSTGGRRRPTRRTWPAQAAGVAVRAVLIGGVGLLLGALVPADFAAVILPYYALFFVLAIPLLTLSPRALAGLAVAIGVGMPLVSHLLRSGTDVRETVPNLTFQDLASDPAGVLRELALTGVYPALSWLAYLCAGMAVGRVALSSRGTIANVIAIGAGLAVGAQAVSWFLLDVLGGRAELEAVATRTMSTDQFAKHMAIGWTGTTPTDTGWWLATATPHSATPLDLAFTTGVALVVLGLAILAGRATTFWLRPLAAAGSMTLTLYSLHLVLLGVPGMPFELNGLFLHTAVVVLFGLLWSRYHSRGPLEAIVGQIAGAVRGRVLRATASSAPPEGCTPGRSPVARAAGGLRAAPFGGTTDLGQVVPVPATALPVASEPSAREPLDRGSTAVEAAPGDEVTVESVRPDAGAGRARSRLLGIDAARGLALLLIMSAHLLPNISVDGRPTVPYLLGGYGAVTFVLLAGVGVALATGGAQRFSGRRLANQVVVLVVRAIAIGSVGLALGYVVSAQQDAVVVLVSFGVMFLLAIPLLGLTTARGAAITAATVALVVPVLTQLSWDHLPAAQEVNHTFGDLVSAPGSWLVDVAVKGVYPALPWMAYFCAGIAVGRLRSLTSERTAGLLLVGGVVMAAAGRLASWALLDQFGGLAALQRSGAQDLADRVTWGPGGQSPRTSWWWLATDGSYSATPPDLVHSAGVALALVGLVLLIVRMTGRLLLPLAAAGSMTLSLYTGHLLVLSQVDLPWGDGTVWLVHSVAVLGIATVWLHVARRGPLESAISALASWAQGVVLPGPAGRHAVRPVLEGDRPGPTEPTDRRNRRASGHPPSRRDRPARCDGMGGPPVAGPLALVYRGPASIDGCPEAVAAALARSRWDLSVRFVGPREQLPLEPGVLAQARLYAQPGGGGLRRAHRKMRTAAGAIREFVRSGGGYLGFCLGGYLAGETPGFGLLPGDTDRFISSPGADPDHDGDSLVTLTWCGRPRRMFFQDGPWFDLDPARGPAEVFARYGNGLPAAVVAPFGRGSVGVVGPHPEASPDWYLDSGLPVPADLGDDLTQDLVDRVLRTGRASGRAG